MLNEMHIEKEIRFIGLQRSGNHAVINWILKQCKSNYLFFNDVDPVDPLSRSRIVEESCNSNEVGCLLYSYEDRLLNVISSAKFYPKVNTYNTKIKKRYDVLVIRDPFNLFASRLKHSAVPTDTSLYISGLSTPNLWITYAKEYLNETSYLNNNKVVINYNRWCISESYRREIANALELNFTDSGFHEITKYGQGSSFDKTAFNGNANMMNTDSRWEIYKNDQEYIALFRDKKIIELSNKIFKKDDNLNIFIENELKPRYNKKETWKRFVQISLFARAIAIAKGSKIIRYLYFTLLLERRKKMALRKSKIQMNKNKSS